jgi:hypothetical protein
MRLIRILEYIGPKDWIEATLQNNYARLGFPAYPGPGKVIRELSCVEIPDAPLPPGDYVVSKTGEILEGPFAGRKIQL